MKIDQLVLSCEHGGNRVPGAYTCLFASAKARAALASHRGCDIGALAIARGLARGLEVPLQAASVTRLLIELNRSEHHRTLFSEFSMKLDAAAKHALLERYYRPYRRRVTDTIAAARGRLVCHISVHSFAAVFEGRRRAADIGLLYDPRRPLERELCERWKRILGHLDPALRVRRNYPYLGKNDGFTTALRQRFGPARYIGIELETNQALLTGSADLRRRTIATLAASVRALMEPDDA